MQTAHDQWLEERYQDAEEAEIEANRRASLALSEHAWLSAAMPYAAEHVADALAETICDKTTWSDADALLMGRILMDELRRLAELEVQS